MANSSNSNYLELLSSVSKLYASEGNLLRNRGAKRGSKRWQGKFVSALCKNRYVVFFENSDRVYG